MPNRHFSRRTVLRTTGGLVATAAGVAVGAGTAAAHFPDALDVTVMPRRERHVVDVDAAHVAVWVAKNDEFSPGEEAPNYRFGASETVDAGEGARARYAYEGIDSLGEGVLVVFPVAGTGLTGDECEAKLVWERHVGGEHGFSGTAPVTVENGEVTPPDAATCEARLSEGDGHDEHGHGDEDEGGSS